MDVGARFGALTVIAEGDRSNGYVRMLCRCDCGTERMIRRNNLMAGKASSCGCVRKAPVYSVKAEKKDLSGKVYGRLTVVKDSGKRSPKRHILWLCMCSCGNEKLVDTARLNRCVTTSCGCFQIEGASARKILNLAGQRFGLLTAISPSAEDDNAGYIRWNVRCDCGTEKTIRSNSLTQGEIISCGCAVENGARRDPLVIARAVVRGARRRALLLAAGGDFTVEDVERIYKAQRGKCAGPGCARKLGSSFHRDHKTPLALGGSNHAWNIELLCQKCNNRKHAKDPIAWANENGMLC